MGRYIYILRFCETHNLVEALPAVIFADGITLLEAYMAICRHKYTYCIGSFLLVKSIFCMKTERLEQVIPVRAGILTV
jgi:hypothetical protein